MGDRAVAPAIVDAIARGFRHCETCGDLCGDGASCSCGALRPALKPGEAAWFVAHEAIRKGSPVVAAGDWCVAPAERTEGCLGFALGDAEPGFRVGVRAG